jgi:hypothetical protein
MVYKSKRLLSDALHFEKHFLAAAVVEFRGAAAGVAGNSLSGFKGSVISQKLRAPGCPAQVRRIVPPYEVPDIYVSPNPFRVHSQREPSSCSYLSSQYLRRGRPKPLPGSD